MTTSPRPAFEQDDEDGSLVRSEEELDLGTRKIEAGTVRVRKDVDVRSIDETFPRSIEDADVDRIDVAEGDSGQIETLADGSVSVPVFEEELVVTKRLRVRERIVVSKRTVTGQQRVRADLRRERVSIEGDEGTMAEPEDPTDGASPTRP
jgi:uncharacterized protein (TIGR02271 family)